MKTIAVFGATGRTGKPFTELALKEGYQVKTLVRTPSRLDIKHSNLQVIQGDLADYAKTEETINGTEAVLFLVGLSPSVRLPSNVRVVMTPNILEAMQKSGLKRVIRLASVISASDPNDKLSFGQNLMMSLGKRMMSVVAQDETESVNLIKQSDFDWTIVRENYIARSAPKGSYDAGYFRAGNNSVAAGDLAAFILD